MTIPAQLAPSVLALPPLERMCIVAEVVRRADFDDGGDHGGELVVDGHAVRWELEPADENGAPRVLTITIVGEFDRTSTPQIDRADRAR